MSVYNSNKLGLSVENFLAAGLVVKIVQNGFFRQVPAVSIANYGNYQCETLAPVGEKVLNRFAFLTIGVVSGHELEGLVHQQHGQRELQHHDPLVQGQCGDVEHNLTQE